MTEPNSDYWTPDGDGDEEDDEFDILEQNVETLQDQIQEMHKLVKVVVNCNTISLGMIKKLKDRVSELELAASKYNKQNN